MFTSYVKENRYSQNKLTQPCNILQTFFPYKEQRYENGIPSAAELTLQRAPAYYLWDYKARLLWGDNLAKCFKTL